MKPAVESRGWGGARGAQGCRCSSRCVTAGAPGVQNNRTASLPLWVLAGWRGPKECCQRLPDSDIWELALSGGRAQAELSVGQRVEAVPQAGIVLTSRSRACPLLCSVSFWQHAARGAGVHVPCSHWALSLLFLELGSCPFLMLLRFVGTAGSRKLSGPQQPRVS